MIIHCTAKLAVKLPMVETLPLQEVSPLGSWHANLLTIDRRQCVIFCHDQSRMTLFAAGLRKDDFATLAALHRRLFLDYLKARSAPPSQLLKVKLALGPVHFDRTTDRSVLASMNVICNDLDGLLCRVENVMQLDPVDVAVKLTHRPCQAKGVYLWPEQEINRLLSRL